MKIALLGKGKTGSKVLELSNDEVAVFDTLNPPTTEQLCVQDVIISFLPGDAFKTYIPMLIEAKRPVVVGSTGLIWPDNMNDQLKKLGLTWIYASNFSMGIIVVKALLKTLQNFGPLFPTKKISIHEVHHVMKKDAPSGTALSMQEWLGWPCDITSERTSDVIGHHELTLDTGTEKITISHEALDRKLFAEGALWAANIVVTKKCETGLISFQSLIEGKLYEH